MVIHSYRFAMVFEHVHLQSISVISKIQEKKRKKGRKIL